MIEAMRKPALTDDVLPNLKLNEKSEYKKIKEMLDKRSNLIRVCLDQEKPKDFLKTKTAEIQREVRALLKEICNQKDK